MKKIIPYLIFAAIVGYYGFYFYVKYAGVKQGELAPDFEVELIDGTDFRLSDLKGGYVLLDFWGSWCGPCRQENPNLAILHNKYPEKLTVVTIALEKMNDAWKKAAKEDGFIWKHQVVEQHKIVMMSDIARKYGVSSIPAKFLIDPEGNLQKGLSFEKIDSILSGTM